MTKLRVRNSRLRSEPLTFHHHVTPITPNDALYSLAGRCFFVSHAAPTQIARVDEIGQSVGLDNGAYTSWRKGRLPDWLGFYAWTERWLHTVTTWAVVPDVIDAGAEAQDELLKEWPHGKRQAAPVWHMDEPIPRLLHLCDQGWNRVCIGSTAEYATVLSESWERRMDDAYNAMAVAFGRIPPLHLLRGMQVSGRRWPLYSVDSSDCAQNHHLPHNSARKIADRWDAVQSNKRWTLRPEQLELVA